MSKFQFSNNNVELDIAGKPFTIPGSVEYAVKIKELGRAATQYAEQLKQRTDEDNALQDAIQFMKSSLDAILGDGACDQIFEGRNDNLYDYIDIMVYISNEFKDFQLRKQAQYSPNRAQRRVVPTKTTSSVINLPHVTLNTDSPVPVSALPNKVEELAKNPEVISAIINAVLSKKSHESAY